MYKYPRIISMNGLNSSLSTVAYSHPLFVYFHGDDRDLRYAFQRILSDV
jgi:hypothetical protein